MIVHHSRGRIKNGTHFTILQDDVQQLDFYIGKREELWARDDGEGYEVINNPNRKVVLHAPASISSKPIPFSLQNQVHCVQIQHIRWWSSIF